MSTTKICPRCGDEYDASVAFCQKDGTRLVARGVQADLIGTIVADRYRIVSRLGEGGMGQVYLAEHVRMKRKSAIKIMRSALVGDVEALQRFTREAENASQINHPNVAAIFDFGESNDGLVYLAMEFVDGTSLAAKLGAEHALHPDIAADILGQAADALQAAHDLGILHRDLKPDNIMLGKRSDGTFMVKLVDFGIARTMDGADQKVTRTGFSIGTPAFMSPEQLAGDSLDARSDQYSLALVAFVALTGKDAFPAESSKESLIARLTSRPRTLQEAKEDVQWPDELQMIFDRALSPEPTERFETVAEFARALSTAISQMTPSQTAELYRRALDIRLSHVAMRTPHSDLQALRTPGSSVASVTPGEERRAVARQSGAYTMDPPLGVTSPLPAQPSNAGMSGGFDAGALASANGGASGGYAPVPADATAVQPGKQTSGAGMSRMIAVAALVVATVAVGGVWMKSRGDGAAAPIDSSAAVASADSAPATAVPAGGSTTAAAPVAGATPTDSATKADSVRRKALADSLKKLQKAYDDTLKARARLVQNFPAGALGGAAEQDFRARTMRRDDVRLSIMSPPITAWRASRIRQFKSSNQRSDGSGPFTIVDPIEVWRPWNQGVSSGRAVYVLEIAPDKVAEPGAPQPEKLFDMKRDVVGVRVLRDDLPIALISSEVIPAVTNDYAHEQAKKPVYQMVVASLPDSAFAKRPDGKYPKIVVVASERTTGKQITFELGENRVRTLDADFSQYRAMLDALPPLPPAPPTTLAPASGAPGTTRSPAPRPAAPRPPAGAPKG